MLQEQNKSKLLDFSFWIFLVSVIFLSIFFIPGGSVPLFFSKVFLLSTGVSISSLLFFIRFIKNKNVTIPKNLIFSVPFFILITTLISALLNDYRTLSLVGYGFEVGTFTFIFLFFSVFFLTILLFPLIKSSVAKSITLLVFVFVLLSLFQISRLIFGANFLSFGIFESITDTPFGNWNELALFSGAMVLLSVFFLDHSNQKKPTKGRLLFLFSLILAVIFLLVINLWIAWLLTLITLLAFLFFQFFRRPVILKEENENKEIGMNDILPAPKISKKSLTFSLSIILIALIFVLPIGGILGNYINDSLGISYLDVKPSWSATLEVFSQTVRESNAKFLFGSGPNSFLFQWRQWKPIEINQTDFWNTEFHYGAGLMPTIFVTTGALGTIFWLLFIGSFFWFGIKYVIKNSRETFSPLFLFLSAYFWIVLFIYPVSHSFFILTALFSGIFLASITRPKLKTFEVSLSSRSRVNIILVLTLIVFVSVSLWISFLTVRQTLSARSFNQGVSIFLKGDIGLAEKKLEKAQRFSSNDIISRYLSEFYLLESKNLAQTVSNPSPEDINRFQKLLQNSKNYAELAVIFNPKSFENWLQLAQFYEFLGDVDPQQSDESLNSARMSYEGAQIFDPKNPLLDLMLARLEFSIGDLDKAEAFVNQSLSKKTNYSEAIFLLSRIKALQGNLDEAINSAKEVVSLNSQEPSAYFQLGLLLYQNAEYQIASEVFNQAILFEPQYSNARYFLGLSLAKVGNFLEATKQFEILTENYSQNDKVKEILSDLKAGRIPFEDNQEEKDSEETELPVTEE